ncbi:T9SS type A sorting domain-containing protein [Flavisolibacter tropicus]|uniref:Secretion system C-terminal sorting domain-containing protein n=1 Tax=Flavisolibacter tropicus TaxID=1492898 RepID=A0A172TZZ2_9BACT|nr:T9SS type A sorting domain-containing protein [Flavisolibacter tropicus]ANE52552.1 hypothetical protein SY85_20795 [Flavisolibacter tropicus]
MLPLQKSNGIYLLTFLFFIMACSEPAGHRMGLNEEENEKQDRIDLAMEQEFRMTLDPALNRVPRERLLTARTYMARLLSLAKITDLEWKERGPNDLAGRTRAILVDRRDATGNTIFAGGVGGGVWRCTNFKTTPVWTPLSDKLTNIAVCALAQDPSNPNILYAGTGEGWFNYDAIRGNGIFKSEDGGNTWNQLPSTAITTITSDPFSKAFDYVQDLAVNSSGILFAAARTSSIQTNCNRGGILRSTDGGVSWQQGVGSAATINCTDALNFYGADLEIATNGDIYATTGFNNTAVGRQGKIWRSTAANAGAPGTWVDITPAGTWERIDIACAPSDANILYALFVVDKKIGAIKRSVNAGVSWQDLPLPSWCDDGETKTDFTRGQAWYDLIVQVDPTNANNVYIGGIDLFKSTNGGTTWTQITQWADGCSTLPVVHADQHNLLFFPNTGTELIASNDGGIYYGTNAGANWVSRNTNYNVTQFYSVDIHPTTANYFLGGAQDHGTMRLTSAGVGTAFRIAGGDGGYAHIDQDNNGRLQVGAFTTNSYFYSRDGGANWDRVSGGNEDGQFVNPTDFDDALDRLYTGNAAGKMGIVTNLNSTSTPAFNDVTLTGLGTKEISAIRVDPTVTTGGEAWIAGINGVPALYKVTGLNTLTPTLGTARSLPVAAGAYVSSIDIDPANASHLLVTVSNYGVVSVLESTNGGASFNNIEGNLPDMPVRWGMIVPATVSVNGNDLGGILIGTELGVWYTPKTAGTSTAWVPQSNNLPNTRIDMLRLRTSDLLLVAATHGRGLYTTNLASSTTGIDQQPNTAGFIQYISANQQQLLIKVGGLTTAKIEMRIYNAEGQLVLTKKDRYVDQHIGTVQFPKGVYILKVFGNNGEKYSERFRL